MAERIESIHDNSKTNSIDPSSDLTSQVRSDVEKLVEELDLHEVVRRVDDFGRLNPIGLALSALTFGVVVGMLMRSPKPL